MSDATIQTLAQVSSRNGENLYPDLSLLLKGNQPCVIVNSHIGTDSSVGTGPGDLRQWRDSRFPHFVMPRWKDSPETTEDFLLI